MSAQHVYGIDLGTTYSCIAYVDEHGKPVVLNSSEGQSTTPSVVFFEDADNIVVGDAAKEVVEMYPDRCVSTVKRAMGDPNWQQTHHGQTYRPQDVSSFILRKLARDAEMISGEKVEQVVITCPAYFGVNEREATKQAGELAGLDVLYVIPEPTAAALAYGIDQSEDQVILVYDLGGGTFDVTLIEIKSGEITVVCTGGDHQLGGRDWDDAVVEHLARRFEAESGGSAEALLDDPEAYQELLSAAEKAKKSLSSRQSIVEAVRFEGERAKVELSRETFDRITGDLLERTLSMTAHEVERAAEKGFAHIDKLLLVGGSTYMPQVLEGVAERFPEVTVQQFDPNQAVAKGAALYGYKCFLDEQVKIRVAEQTGQQVETVDLGTADVSVVAAAEQEVAQEVGMTLPGLRKSRPKITNVSSKSFGTVAFNKAGELVVFNLIRKDERVPAKITRRFGTHAEGQDRVEVECRESVLAEKEVAVDDTREVGKAELQFGQVLPQNSPVELTFELAEDGTLTVSGRDVTTGKSFVAEYKTDSIMTREEVEQARQRNLHLQVA